jgi:hypothetical protein
MWVCAADEVMMDDSRQHAWPAIQLLAELF